MLHSRRGFSLVVGFALAVLTGCQDTVSPDRPGMPEGVRPHFAQGDDGLWTVTTLDDPGDGTCDDTECTLREAIIAASDGDRIGFAAGLEGDIKLTAGQLDVIGKELMIDGEGHIGVDGQRLSRVFDVDGANGNPLLTLKGLTVKNGNAGSDGGGIAVYKGASLQLENVTVADNETTANGGGIHLGIVADLLMINSTVDGNRARDDGGGIYSQSELVIIASTISRNIARQHGGGINLSGSAPSRIERTTISGNRLIPQLTESTFGAGIHTAGILAIRSSTITGNKSEGEFSRAGGLLVQTGQVTLANSILAGNGPALEGNECASLGTTTSLGHNLFVSGVNMNLNCFTTAAAGDVGVVSAQVFTEVLEQTLKNNGGPTETHALIVRGRAMDAGYCPGETEDQRGLLRPVDIEVMPNALDGCDIGAYEAQGPVVARTDLMVSQSANKVSVKAGDLLTYTVRVQNLGPEFAPNTVLTNVLSTGVAFVSATHANGTHTAPPVGETGTITWTLGDLLDQANETAEIKVTVRIKGKTSITNTASVTADIVDLNPANNSASLRTTVGAGGKAK